MPLTSAVQCSTPAMVAASDTATAELARRGYEDVRPVYDFAMRAIAALGFEVLRTGEAIFDELRDQWERQVGPAELENLEAHLTEPVGTSPVRFDTPGWMSRDVGAPI